MKPTTTYRNTDVRKGSVLKTAIMLIVLALAALSLTSCEKAEYPDPQLVNEPTVIEYTVLFKEAKPKRVIARMINATYHGDKLDAIVIDTILYESTTLFITKPYGKYAFVSLEAYAIDHYDYIKVAIEWQPGPGYDVSHTNSCVVRYMDIQEQFIEVKNKS